MDETGRIITKMNEIIKRIDECKDEAITSIMSVNAISEETAAASEEVSAAAEEQKAVSEQVKGMADTLHKMASDLVSAINIFQTRGRVTKKHWFLLPVNARRNRGYR